MKIINSSLNKILDQFPQLNGVKSCEAFGGGHINDTYLAVCNTGSFILQKVNGKIFGTQELVSNYEVLIAAVSDYQLKTGQWITPEIYKNKTDNYHFVNEDGAAWRLVEFIANADSFDISPNTEISYEAAKAIGKYQLFLNTIEPSLMQDTIVGFHNLPSRMQAFVESIDTAEKLLLENAADEVSLSRELSYIVQEVQKSMAQLPLRITHNDTKLNNVLFKDDDVLTIDLDTVMHGNVMYDYGDMVRTFTSPALEDERDLLLTDFRLDHFEALTKGYLEPLKDDLTASEKASLYYGALYIIYEQVLRFLTDYLRGNVYYKVAYPDHNLVRTRTQLKLLKLIVDNEEELKNIIKKYC